MCIEYFIKYTNIAMIEARNKDIYFILIILCICVTICIIQNSPMLILSKLLQK